MDDDNDRDGDVKDDDLDRDREGVNSVVLLSRIVIAMLDTPNKELFDCVDERDDRLLLL